MNQQKINYFSNSYVVFNALQEQLKSKQYSHIVHIGSVRNEMQFP